MNRDIVKCININKSYQLGKLQVPALHNINVTFSSGFTLLLGPSGSGKSTLLNIIGCIDSPNSGNLIINQNDITKFNDKQLTQFRRDNIGFIFQSFSLIGSLNVVNNIEYPIIKNRDYTIKERREKALYLLEEVGLSGYAFRFPRELSGGQMQRIAIARALIINPKIIIADEPTASLDSHTGHKIIDILDKMHREHNTSIILSSHDKNVIERIERVINIKDGYIEEV